MRPAQCTSRFSSQAGQSLIETALLIPLLALLVLNAINFGYYFVVALHIAAAPRAGIEYAIQGSQTPAATTIPPAGPATTATTVSYLTYQDMRGLINTSNTPVQVCSKSVDVGPLLNPGTTSQRADCKQFGNAANPAFPTALPDPESPIFVLQRVDVQYTVKPLISAQPFGITLLPTYTFQRQVSMRAID